MKDRQNEESARKKQGKQQQMRMAMKVTLILMTGQIQRRGEVGKLCIVRELKCTSLLFHFRVNETRQEGN